MGVKFTTPREAYQIVDHELQRLILRHSLLDRPQHGRLREVVDQHLALGALFLLQPLHQFVESGALAGDDK